MGTRGHSILHATGTWTRLKLLFGRVFWSRTTAPHFSFCSLFVLLLCGEERPMTNAAKEQSSEAQDLAPDLEAEVDEAIRICSGDVRAALRATLVANSFLEGELNRLTEAIS